MPETLEYIPIWIALEPALRGTPPVNVATKREPECWRGNDIEFNFGVFTLRGEPADLSNVATFNVVARDSDTPGSPLLFQRSLAPEDLSPVITKEGFRSYDERHAAVRFTKAETSVAMNNAKVRKVWVVVYGLTADGQELTYGAFWFLIFDDAGGQDGTPPPVPPSTYYTQAQVDGLLALKAASVHTHAISDVSGLQAALNGKSNTGHTHAIGDVINLQSTLDGKSNTGHVHAIADVTGLQTALNGKSNTGHTHAIADVVNLQSTLDGKSNTGHVHAAADITSGVFSTARLPSAASGAAGNRVVYDRLAARLSRIAHPPTAKAAARAMFARYRERAQAAAQHPGANK